MSYFSLFCASNLALQCGQIISSKLILTISAGRISHPHFGQIVFRAFITASKFIFFRDGIEQFYVRGLGQRKILARSTGRKGSKANIATSLENRETSHHREQPVDLSRTPCTTSDSRFPRKTCVLGRLTLQAPW